MSLEKSRRAFLADAGKLIGGAAFAAITLPILQACEPTSMPKIDEPIIGPTDPDGRIAVDVSDLNDAKPAKRAAGLRGPDGKGVIVTRVSDTEYHALSMKCTHEGCDVGTEVQAGAMTCPCHQSQFKLNGDVVRGPAAAPLPQYDSVYDAEAKQLRIKLT
jgi:Rieske Fe-S protein